MLPEDWASLVALLDGRPDADPMTRVQRLCGLGAEITAMSGASLGIATNHTRSTVAATDEVSNRLQDLQSDFDEGPGLDAVRRGRSWGSAPTKRSTDSGHAPATAAGG